MFKQNLYSPLMNVAGIRHVDVETREAYTAIDGYPEWT